MKQNLSHHGCHLHLALASICVDEDKHQNALPNLLHSPSALSSHVALLYCLLLSTPLWTPRPWPTSRARAAAAAAAGAALSPVPGTAESPSLVLDN